MAKRRGISPTALGGAISEQLTMYHTEVIEKLNAAGETAIKDLVEKTKATAPKLSGSFRKKITSTAVDGGRLGDKTYVWYVKAPDYRLTHLLVHGHAKRGGGRVPGDPFLQNALDKVLPEYERAVEEAIKNG